MVGDDQFYHALRASVWIGGANWAVLRDRNHVWDSSRIAVDSRGRGEDNVRNIVLGHAAEERDGSANVNTVVFEWDLGGFSDRLGSKG